MMWLALLKRLWPLLAGAAVLVSAYLWHASEVGAARTEGYQKAQAEYAAALDREREHQREVSEEISRVHQDTVAALQSRVRKLSRSTSVSLCEPADQVRSAADPAGAADGAADGHGLRARREVGPGLVQYAGECEQLRRQLLAIKRWQSSL